MSQEIDQNCACGGLRMILGTLPDDDIMNTPCPLCNENSPDELGAANCSAVEVKNWTATDAQNALMMIDRYGRRFQVKAIGWDGTVHVVASDTIKPEGRDGWRLFVIRQNAKGEIPT